MVLFLVLLLLGLALLLLPARLFDHKGWLLVFVRIAGMALLACGGFLLYGLYADFITFPLL